MSGQGRRVFEPGELLTSANVNGFLMDQAVMVFADATERAAEIPTPTAGMHSYRTNGTAVEVYNGTSWVSANSVGGTVVGSQVTGFMANSSISTVNVLRATKTIGNAQNLNVLPEDQNQLWILTQSTRSVFIALTTAAAFGVGRTLQIIYSFGSPYTVQMDASVGVTIAGSSLPLGASGFRVPERGTVTITCVSNNNYRITGDYQAL